MIVITKRDVAWNFIATFLKTASSIILLPLILKCLSAQEIGIWTIFISIGGLASIADFGFSPSFSRNITFIFSGVNKLSKVGFDNESNTGVINYVLLKTALKAMKYFYSRVALFVFLFLSVFGTYYIQYVLKDYQGSNDNIYLAWFIFICYISFNMYTIYFESLLIGKGFIKESKQIDILTQIIYLFLATILLLLGYGLVGFFGAQLFASILTRYLSQKKFYTPELKDKLNNLHVDDYKEIIRTIFPNAIKGGISSMGSLFIYRSPLLIGSMFLSLQDIGSYGLTRQIFDVIYLVASTYSITYFSKLSSNWAINDINANRIIYVKSLLVTIFLYLLAIPALVFFANPFLKLYGSNTLLLEGLPLYILIVHYFFNLVHGQSIPIVVSRNHLPLYYLGFIGGIIVIILTFVMLKYFSFGVLALVISPTIVYMSYENWKWPSYAFKVLELNFKTFLDINKLVISDFYKSVKLKFTSI